MFFLFKAFYQFRCYIRAGNEKFLTLNPWLRLFLTDEDDRNIKKKLISFNFKNYLLGIYKYYRSYA